jgi:hypothetical protein
MRLALKAVMLTIVIFGAVNYMSYLQTGSSLLPIWAEKTMAKIAHAKVVAIQALNSVNAREAQDSEAEVIYKWTDADGVLQYTNVPPSQGINAEIVQVDSNTNLIPAVTASQSEAEAVPLVTVPAVAEKLPAGPDQPFPYTPEQVKKTMDDARNVQQMMNEKLEKQQQVLDEL